MDYGRIADILSRMVGGALVMAGTNGLFRPFDMTKWFGIPNTTEQHAVLFPGIGGRNVAVGLSILLLSFTGQRQAAGTLLACTMITGLADTRICWQHGKKWSVHALNTGIVGLLGLLSLRDGRGEEWQSQAILAGIVGLVGWQALRPTEEV